MSSITYEGIVDNGNIHLLTDVRLPDQTKVYVTVEDAQPHHVVRIASPRLVHPEQIVDFQKQMIEDEADASV